MLDTASPFAAPLAAPAAEARLDVATRRLRKAVITCEIGPGEFVHEAALAERFGLGRAGIRVALTELAAARFASRHARQGWRIAPVDGALIAAVLDGRRRLEPSLATQALGPAARDALMSLVAMVESAADRSEPAALATARAAERRLRDLVAAGAGGFVRRWLGEIWDHGDRILRLLDLAGCPVPPASHRALVTALARGDSAAARDAITQDIQRLGEALAQGFLAISPGLAGPPPRSARRRRGSVATARSDKHPVPLAEEQQR